MSWNLAGANVNLAGANVNLAGAAGVINIVSKRMSVYTFPRIKVMRIRTYMLDTIHEYLDKAHINRYNQLLITYGRLRIFENENDFGMISKDFINKIYNRQRRGVSTTFIFIDTPCGHREIAGYNLSISETGSSQEHFQILSTAPKVFSYI